ncbi:MAG: hypothetical protein IJ057_10925 [Bacteroidales bacterium]|nr:hypothetical protein [Bacteroidales bacterium]
MDSTFAKVYALRKAHPDSALVLFNEIADSMDELALDQQSRFQYYEYQLLKAELNRRNFHPMGNDSLVFQACAFYDSAFSQIPSLMRNEALVFQYAHACYLKAVIEEMSEDLHAQSFSDYLRALWLMDGLNKTRRIFASRSDNKEYQYYTGLIYDRLAWFLYNHDSWSMAIECLNQSNAFLSMSDNQAGIALNLHLMGDVMLAQENRDSAAYYYERSDSIYALLQTETPYRRFTGMLHHALEMSNVGDKEEAKELLLNSINDTERPWMARKAHFGLAYIYYDLQEYDSALYHYELCHPLLPRQTIKSYSRIVQIANQLGDYEKAAYYGGLLAEYYTNQVRQGELRTQIIAMYDEFKEKTKDERDRDVFLFVVAIIVLLAAIIVLDSIFIQHHKRRRRRDREAHEKIKATLEDEIESIKQASRNRDAKIKDLETQLNKVVSHPDFQKLPFDQKMETLGEMPICKRVRTVMDANVKAFSSYPELVLSENQFTMLVNAVDTVFPKFSVRIIEMYPRLKRSDVMYCCLYILGITEVQAAALTGKTYQAVWSRSLKLHEIFGSKSNLQLVLHGFLKDW